MNTMNSAHEIKKGLIADHIVDHNDYFSMVSLDIRFAEPGGDEHIDKDVSTPLKNCFYST